MKNQILKSSESVRSHSRPINAIGIAAFSVAFVLFAAVLVSSQGRVVLPKDQKWFASPQEAAEAFTVASENYDEAAFKEILGPNSFDLIHTGEPNLDKQMLADFASMARAKTTIAYDPKNRSRAIIVIGNDAWPFAIPVAKAGLKWFFDTDAGRREIVFRRIGRNELDAIQVCRGFVEAQDDYSLVKHDNAPVNQYAQKI